MAVSTRLIQTNRRPASFTEPKWVHPELRFWERLVDFSDIESSTNHGTRGRKSNKRNGAKESSGQRRYTVSYSPTIRIHWLPTAVRLVMLSLSNKEHSRKLELCCSWSEAFRKGASMNPIEHRRHPDWESWISSSSSPQLSAEKSLNKLLVNVKCIVHFMRYD